MKQYAIALTLGPFKLGMKQGLEGQTRVQRQGDFRYNYITLRFKAPSFPVDSLKDFFM
jgi:hypothetical protein